MPIVGYGHVESTFEDSNIQVIAVTSLVELSSNARHVGCSFSQAPVQKVLVFLAILHAHTIITNITSHKEVRLLFVFLLPQPSLRRTIQRARYNIKNITSHNRIT